MAKFLGFLVIRLFQPIFPGWEKVCRIQVYLLSTLNRLWLYNFWYLLPAQHQSRASMQAHGVDIFQHTNLRTLTQLQSRGTRQGLYNYATCQYRSVPVRLGTQSLRILEWHISLYSVRIVFRLPDHKPCLSPD